MIKITVLAENTVRRPDLMAEHGLAFWVETPESRFLFDTGQGLVLQHNAAVLGIELSSADMIVLSHGHYDHTGDLARVLALAPQAPVVAHPDAFRLRYSASTGSARMIGAPMRELGDRLNAVTEATWLTDTVGITGEIPRISGIEDTGGAFYLDESCREPDPILDDQAVVLRHGDKVVVLLGCAHSGTINTLLHIQDFCGCPIHAVIGGMHLGHASDERLDATIKLLQELNLGCLAPMHCTGAEAVEGIARACPACTVHRGVGDVFVFE